MSGIECRPKIFCNKVSILNVCMGRSNIHARFQKKLNFTLKMVSIEVRPEDITSLIIVLRSLEVLVFPKVLEEYSFQSKNL